MSDEKSFEVSLARAPDAYEKSFMGVGEDVVLRDKMSYPWPFHLLMLLAIIGGAVGVLGSGAPIAVALVPLLVGLLAWSTITTLRTTVSTENVHVQYGVIGPTIPIDSIERCEAIDYNWWKYGGWGIRYSLLDRSWAYNMLGDGGRGVWIEYRDGKRTKRILIASKAPELVADAINRARSGTLAQPYAEEVELDLGADVAVEQEIEEHQPAESQ